MVRRLPGQQRPQSPEVLHYEGAGRGTLRARSDRWTAEDDVRPTDDDHTRAVRRALATSPDSSEAGHARLLRPAATAALVAGLRWRAGTRSSPWTAEGI